MSLPAAYPFSWEREKSQNRNSNIRLHERRSYWNKQSGEHIV